MRCSKCGRATSGMGSRLDTEGNVVCERKQCFTDYVIRMARDATEIPRHPRRSTVFRQTEQREIAQL